jgi:uncharacterized protein
VRLVLTSDTHLPRTRGLPAGLWSAIETADVVFHAGDWCDEAALDMVAEAARRLVAVHGNNDTAAVRDRLPEVARAELSGVRFSVVHDTGPARGREARCADRFPDADVLVFGHSHIPWDTTASTGLRLLNPGSPTDRRRQPHHTYMTARLVERRLVDVVVHELPSPPGRQAGRHLG